MKLIITISLQLLSVLSYAQIDTTLFKRTKIDTTKQHLNMDAAYGRPF